MPADKAEAKKEWERYPNRLRRPCETRIHARKRVKHCREWPAGETELEIKLILIQENSKSQDLMVYTDGSVTKDLVSGWGFNGKQGATTIHEDSAAYTISTSSLTMEVEAVTHAIRWIASRGDSQPHMPSSSQIQ